VADVAEPHTGLTSLSSKVAVVTGGGRGLGRGISIALASRGAHVIVASRGQEALDRSVADINDRGLSATGYRVDMSDREHVEAMFSELESQIGGIDILVNNAQSWGSPGSRDLDPPVTPLEAESEEVWDWTYQSGLKSTLYAMWSCHRLMRDGGGGRIINVSSPAAEQSWPGYAAYNCAKAAVVSLTKTAAREWGRHGITVNCISPLVVADLDRDRFDGIEDDDERERARNNLLARLSVPRYGDAINDVGSTVAFLASDEAGYITGAEIPVNGGLSV
jgi:NAD(P)-dependent dehydrogenase (short-subunit alcohol dehydrogenase family)